MGASVDPRLAQLRALLEEVRVGNRFYRGKLTAVGCSGLPTSLEDFHTRFPTTLKTELVANQAAHPPYGSNLTYPLERYTRCHQTSGTSGAPLRWLDTPESWDAMTQDWTEVLRAAGVGPGDCGLFAFSFGPFLGFWLAFEAAQRLGCRCLAGGGMSSALRVRVLFEHRCTVLCGTPTYALHLAEVARAEGFDPTRSGLRTLVVAGEPGGSLPVTRSRLSEAWGGARVFDHHGMTEVGPVSYEDPARPGSLVILDQSFLAEVLAPGTGQAVAPGAVGELVLTTLHRAGSPLLRYRTGDLVRLQRADGRSTLDGGILGRVDDMVIVRGVNVYPSAVEEIVRGIPGIGEYRVTHDTRAALPELSVEVEADDGRGAELAQALQELLTLRVPVTCVAEGSLPRFELKARRWRRL